MNKSERKKLAKQIARLCEKQYRKGFQQGFHTCVNKQMTLDEVNEFRMNGMVLDYKILRWPHNGREEDPFNKLEMECWMSDMEELKRLLSEFEK